MSFQTSNPESKVTVSKEQMSLSHFYRQLLISKVDQSMKSQSEQVMEANLGLSSLGP